MCVKVCYQVFNSASHFKIIHQRVEIPQLIHNDKKVPAQASNNNNNNNNNNNRSGMVVTTYNCKLMPGDEYTAYHAAHRNFGFSHESSSSIIINNNKYYIIMLQI